MRDFLRICKMIIPINTRIINTLLTLCLGIALGIFSKFLDNTPSNELPFVFEYLDIRNFLGRLSIWILLAVIISIRSRTPSRAALNVFVFFVGMISSYYLYSKFIAGFFPIEYVKIWVGFTIISPLLAYICWYANLGGIIAVFISSGILGVLLAQAINLIQGFYVYHGIEIIIWIIGLVLLRRHPKEYAVVIAISFVVALVYQLVMPYWG